MVRRNFNNITEKHANVHKKLLVIFMILCIVLAVFPANTVLAVVEETGKPYIIFNELGEVLLEKTDVVVGDYYITANYEKYEIVAINEELGIGEARFVKRMQRPNVNINKLPTPIETSKDKVICLYMTHNDESYVPTDGVDSVYGKGGIHDVAKHFANALRSNGIDTYIDETLHIPHDTKAYSRSMTTCKNMLSKYNPNAIFDIHRDGTSRSYYITEVNGKEECMVRIVVGKANSNMAINEEFALYIMAVAQEVAPGLIKDIYYASGHYNQNLYAKSLLFEMGSHMVEKELVLDSAKKLANVVNTALFATTVDEENNDISINDIPTENAPLVDDVLNDKIEISQNSINTSVILRLLIVLSLISLGIWIIIDHLGKINKKRKK